MWHEGRRDIRFPGWRLVKGVVPVTRRTTAIGFGIGLVLVGLILIYNFGLASLATLPSFASTT